jgi:phospholipid/cholesterol/gamma-HCH transport system substrate-binding protein
VSAAAQRFEEASASFGSFSSNADAQITQFGGEANALIADLRNVTENANTAVEESNRAISAAADAIEGPATDALQDARLASRDLRVLIARLDRVARELEQNPQGFVVGDPAPYEESR